MKRHNSMAVLVLAGSLAFGLVGPVAAQQGNPPYGGQGPQGESRPSAGQVEGKVTSVDARARSITIDGQSFEVGRRVDLTKVKVGDGVRVGLKLSQRGTKRVHTLETLPPAK